MNKPATWVLMDASNSIYRDFHAAGDKCQELTEGRIELLNDHIKPDRIAVCFDSPSSFRRKVDTSYKANRSVRPATVGIALAGLREYCLDCEIDCVDCDGFEADDCMATVAKIGVSCGVRVILHSTDKDLRQCLYAGLVNQMTQIKRMGKHVFTRYETASSLLEEYGVRPDQWCDYQCLVGEPGDNVKGAQGIGPDAARKILRACESIEAYYENPWLANLTAKQMVKMQEFRPRWRTVERLIRLRTDVPLPEGWEVEAS